MLFMPGVTRKHIGRQIPPRRAFLASLSSSATAAAAAAAATTTAAHAQFHPSPCSSPCPPIVSRFRRAFSTREFIIYKARE